MPDKDNFNAVICAQVSTHGEIAENIAPTIKNRDYKDPAIICFHGSQDPISNEDHANAVNRNNGLENCICYSFMGGQGAKAGSIGYQEEISPTIKSAESGSNTIPDVMCFQQNERQEVRFMHHDGQIHGSIQAQEGEHQRNYVCYDARGNGDGDVAPTNTGDHQDRVTDYTALCVPINSMVIGKELKEGDRQTVGIGDDGDPSSNLQSEHHHAVAIAENVIGRKVENGGNGIGAQTELAYTQNTSGVMGVSNNATVRRLLPMECERLMGFPEVDILEIGKMTKDEFIAWELASGNITVDFSTGKVFSSRTGGGMPCLPHELEGTILSGYKIVSLREKEVKKQCRVHRIMWIAAHGIIPDGYVIDHINNDKLDNRLCNLQLLRPEENSTKAAKDGLYLSGEDHPKTKLTDEQKNDIITLYETEYYSVRRLADIYGVSKSRIHQLVKHDIIILSLYIIPENIPIYNIFS